MVLSEIPGEKVLLDGIERGLTTLFIKEIGTGQHSIKIRDQVTDITIYQNHTLTVKLEDGKLNITNDLRDQKLKLENAIAELLKEKNWTKAEENISLLENAYPEIAAFKRVELRRLKYEDEAAKLKKLSEARALAEDRMKKRKVKAQHLHNGRCEGFLEITDGKLVYKGRTLGNKTRLHHISIPISEITAAPISTNGKSFIVAGAGKKVKFRPDEWAFYQYLNELLNKERSKQ